MNKPVRTLRVQVASPCPVSWESMTGDEKARFCAICQKHVYNLSAMKLGEAQDLLRSKEGKACVRFYERPDGTVMTEDCGFAVARAAERAKRSMTRTFGAAIGLLGLAGLGNAIFGDDLRSLFGARTSMGLVGAVAEPPPAPKHRVVMQGFAAYSTAS